MCVFTSFEREGKGTDGTVGANRSVLSRGHLRSPLKLSLPICSIYGRFFYIYHKFKPRVGKYSIHGASGLRNCPNEICEWSKDGVQEWQGFFWDMEIVGFRRIFLGQESNGGENSSGENSSEPWKNHSYLLPLNPGCLIGIITMASYNPHISTWNPKQPFINGCFNWMIPNLYIGNGCFTKHPFKTGWLWGTR